MRATWRQEAAEHEAILAAAEAGDAAGAADLVATHIRGFLTRAVEERLLT
jgi:DNA-binding GntR family transcriptional regulator